MYIYIYYTSHVWPKNPFNNGFTFVKKSLFLQGDPILGSLVGDTQIAGGLGRSSVGIIESSVNIQKTMKKRWVNGELMVS